MSNAKTVGILFDPSVFRGIIRKRRAQNEFVCTTELPNVLELNYFIHRYRTSIYGKGKRAVWSFTGDVGRRFAHRFRK